MMTNDCEACGFVDAAVTMEDAVVALRGFGRRYRAPLTRFLPGEDGDAILRERPQPAVWSALEYAGHVGQVFRNYNDWVRRALVEDDPVIEAPTPDEAVEAEWCNEADPVEVAGAIAERAEALAATLEAVPEDATHRCHVRRGEHRSVIFTARRAVHEGNHHLLDIGRGLRAVRQRARGTS